MLTKRVAMGLTSIGLFSGIGGIEEGLRRSGHKGLLLCEIDKSARMVLAERFPDVPILKDVRTIKKLPQVDIWTAGFPCQDLSQAGQTKGIQGAKSRLVAELFRLLRTSKHKPKWLILENVPFMLSLAKGRAMSFVVNRLEELGYQWAYRIIDTRAFGLPQRRRRVIIVASKIEDPRGVLFADAVDTTLHENAFDDPCGFYWTEGLTGLGWAVNAVPPLKGGSSLGIPSPPAIWYPSKRFIGTPDIRDAERLQGLPANWTSAAADENTARNVRWRLVGNAVSAPVLEWIGDRLERPGEYDDKEDELLRRGDRWPRAAWGRKGKAYTSQVSEWPVRKKYKELSKFLNFNAIPLSERATAGFLSRALRSQLTMDKRFLKDVEYHLKQMKKDIYL